jgi:selenocysteine-specific elongation factor
VSINSLIEIPHLQVQRKVKSMQMFHKPVKVARQGDRVGICVSNLDSSSVERSIAITPGSVPLLSSAICLVKKVRFFKGACRSTTKFHISIGHTTVLASVIFFGSSEEMDEIAAKCGGGSSEMGSAAVVDDVGGVRNVVVGSNAEPTEDKLHSQQQIGKPRKQQQQQRVAAASSFLVQQQTALNAQTYERNFPPVDYPWDSDFMYLHELPGGSDGQSALSYGHEPLCWAFLQFQQPVFCPLGSLIIASRLDTDVSDSSSQSSSNCRLAFYGPLRADAGDRSASALERIRIFNWKEKTCQIFKPTDVRISRGVKECFEAVGFKLVSEAAGAASVISRYVGMSLRVDTSDDDDGGYRLGKITGPYGSDGM